VHKLMATGKYTREQARRFAEQIAAREAEMRATRDR
jgi:hypothetical protein